MTEQVQPTMSDLNEDEFDKLTSSFKSTMQAAAETEESLIEKYGFYVKAYNDHAVSRGIVLDGRKIAIFARTSITGGRELAEAVGVVAAKINEEKDIRGEYPLPFAVEIEGKPRVMLRNRLIKVDNASFNRYAHAAAMIPMAHTDEEVYVLLIGDDYNNLPGEAAYNDIGQYRLLPEPEAQESQA